MSTISRIFVLVISLVAAASAQWLNYPTTGMRRTADGKPNLSAPAQKTPDGKPDLSGIWAAREQLSLYGEYKSHFMDLALDLKPEEAPFQPWAKALSQHRQDNEH